MFSVRTGWPGIVTFWSVKKKRWPITARTCSWPSAGRMSRDVAPIETWFAFAMRSPPTKIFSGRADV